MNNDLIPAKFLGALCICVLCIILTAGLWPFHAPRNQVDWLTSQNGLHFGGHGSILSSGVVRKHDAKGEDVCSFEIWLQPDVDKGMKTILGFYDAESSTVPFALRQYFDGLFIRNAIDPHDRLRKPKFGIGDVFHPGNGYS